MTSSSSAVYNGNVIIGELPEDTVDEKSNDVLLANRKVRFFTSGEQPRKKGL